METIATRDAYGKKLAELGEKYPEIVALDADLSGSTKTAVFAKKFPQRFFNVGVAEQDLMGAAAGLALGGKLPYASSFAMFACGRAWEIIRNSIGYPHLPVRIAASHAGISVGEDGASHQMIEDVALMRVIPGMAVVVPADGVETEAALEALVHHPGPVYFRLSRPKTPVLHDAAHRFTLGKANVLREGSQIAIVGMGVMVYYGLEAAKLLEAKGLKPTVVNCASVKPIDEALLQQLAGSHDLFVTVEEHSIIGGRGEAVAGVGAGGTRPRRVHRLGMRDEFGQSGPWEKLLAHYRLTAQDIANETLAAWNRR